MDHQNNYCNNINNYKKRLSVDDNAAKSFNILAISLNVLHNYFDSLIKLFSNPYLKF